MALRYVLFNFVKRTLLSMTTCILNQIHSLILMQYKDLDLIL